MANTDQPVWLKVMEHGAAGEARTKAFLLDREPVRNFVCEA